MSGSRGAGGRSSIAAGKRLPSVAAGPTQLEEHLLREHSRRNTDTIIRWIGSDPLRVKLLMRAFAGSDPLLSQRSAWVVGILGEQRPCLLAPWLRAMMRAMRAPGVHDAIRRNGVRALQFADIPPHLLGEAAALCFDELCAAKSPVAVKACAMTVLASIARRKPALGRELRLVIEQHMEFARPGFRARARAVLAQLADAPGDVK